MKALTGTINETIASFPYESFMMNEHTPLKPAKPVEPELPSTKPTALDLSVYADRQTAHASEMVQYESLKAEYDSNKKRFDDIASTKWDRFIIAMLMYIGQDVNDANVKLANSLGSATGLPKSDKKRMAKTIESFMRHNDRMMTIKPEQMLNMSSYPNHVRVAYVICHDIEKKVLNAVFEAFDAYESIQPGIGYFDNIVLPANPMNIQYATNIIAKATGATGITSVNVKRMDGNVLIPISYMIKALQMRFCQ